MLLSPEIAVREFEQAWRKYKDAIDIIEKYGAGRYTPGDIEDLDRLRKECIQWIDECKAAIREAERKKKK